MKKKILLPCLLLVLVAVVSSLLVFGLSAENLPTMTQVAAGEVTPEAGDTVTISSVAEMQAFSKYVSQGNPTEGITFKLTEDIELAVEPVPGKTYFLTNLNPIGGVYNGATETQAFKGIFDGNDKKILNFNLTKYYATPDGTTETAGSTALTSVGGLFELLDGGTVKNLTLGVFQVQQVRKENYGVLVAEAINGAKILNCHVNAVITTTKERPKATSTYYASVGSQVVYAGGLVGKAENTVIDSCSVNLNLEGSNNIGGLVGAAKDTAIRNSMVDGSMYTNEEANMVLGGIAAELTGASCVENCFSSADLVGAKRKEETMGGVVGKLGVGGTVENCFSEATIRTEGADAIEKGSTFGSLVAVNDGTVKFSYGLRDAAKKNYEAHNDIGTGVGTAESIYVYTVEGVEFKVGTLAVENAPCSPEVHADSKCTADSHSFTCKVCNSDGVADIYTFVPDDDFGSLVDALNAWVDSKKDSGVEYLSWVVDGTTIVNCSHKVQSIFAYEGQEATCAGVGYGDLACASCGYVTETNVEIPVNPKNHLDKHTYACAAYFCTGCNNEVAAIKNHGGIDEKKTCIDQTCRECGELVEHQTEHVHPDDAPFDPEKPCAVYTCTMCKQWVSDADHSVPEGTFYSCQTILCTVCDYTVQEATSNHAPGRSPSCERDQVCLDCGKVIQPALGHDWGDPATCSSAQTCKTCYMPNLDANGDGVQDLQDDTNEDGVLDEKDVLLPHTKADGAVPDCIHSVNCLVCDTVIEKALGHKPDANATLDCGHGRSCTVCSAMIQSATSAHTVDWSQATVVRAATATRTGIVEAACSVCGRKVEAYTTYTVSNAAGTVSISGLNELLFIGSSATLTVKKVSDLKGVAVGNGYVAIQAAEITVQDADGDDMAVSGTATVRLVLNKSAAKIDAGKLKMYQVNGTTATEVAITAVDAEGYITFTASGAGTFLLAAENTVAQSVIGVKK